MCGVAGGWGARGGLCRVGLLRCAPRVPPCVREDCASGSEDLCGSTGRPRLSITPLHARKTSTSGSHRAFLLPLLHYCPYVLRENHRFSNISPHVSTTSASYESKRHHPSSSPFPPSASATSIETRVCMYHRNRLPPSHTHTHTTTATTIPSAATGALSSPPHGKGPVPPLPPFSPARSQERTADRGGVRPVFNTSRTVTPRACARANASTPTRVGIDAIACAHLSLPLNQRIHPSAHCIHTRHHHTTHPPAHRKHRHTMMGATNT